MDRPTLTDWHSLAQDHSGPCATIYLPTFPGTADEYQDHIRLKNLATQVSEELLEHGMPAGDVKKFEKQVLSLPDNDSFWQNRSKGLAIFSSSGVFQAWRLPIVFSEFAYVGRRFQIAPLLPLFTSDQTYFVLALSHNQVRLYKGSRDRFTEIPCPDFPKGVVEGTNYAVVSEGGQVHSGAPARFGKRGSVHHGHGGVADFEADEFVSYLRLVNSQLNEVLRGSKEPLVVAATKTDLAVLRDVLTYKHVIEDAVEGNCDHLSPHEIQLASWGTIEKTLAHRREQAIAEYKNVAHTPRASCEPADIIPAAIQGRVKTLFIDLGAKLWGEFEEKTQTIRTHGSRQRGDDDLMDRAAVETSLKHGDVYHVDPSAGPSASSIAAIFRY